jgi:hypothetical protein
MTDGTGYPGYSSGQGEPPGPSSPWGAAQPGPPPSGYGTPGYGAPNYGAPSYGAPNPGAPNYGVPGYGVPFGQPPPTHLIWARIAAVGGVLFNLILGLPMALAAMRHGRKVRQLWESGDQQGAVAASRKARSWAIASTVMDGIGVIFLIVVIAAAATAATFNNPATVAASIKTQLQKRISDPSSQYYVPGLKVTSVVCHSTGNHIDTCVDHFSNGKNYSEIAVISDNGHKYFTR